MPPSKVNSQRFLLKEIQPIRLDSNITFSAIGGLEEHIKCLREMVLFPLIYRDFFKRFNTRPPKGVLFHGPPGTGKTLLARALANECSQMRGKRVSFFMRKGADIMSKWYGESEKHLKLLFQQANKMRPSIIFFDEIDALAPIRSEVQGEVYASVIATLLVELDGLWDRGEVIVIGATNRPDCLDPALRRPGRFDRELYFPPPNLLARKDILEINTRHWLPRPTEEMLEFIAQRTNGFLGSDISALCSEAVLKALRRLHPQLYEGNYSGLPHVDTRKMEVTLEDMLEAKRAMCPSGARYSPMVARHLPEELEPLLGDQVKAASEIMHQIFPAAADKPGLGEASAAYVFLICGDCAEVFLAPALLAQLEHCSVQELSMSTLHSAHTYSQERAIISIFSDCRRTDRNAVIFIPNIKDVWEALAYTPAQSLLLQQWRTRAAGDKALLLATCHGPHSDLPDQLRELFPLYKNCVYRVRNPTPMEVTNFFAPILEKLPTILKTEVLKTNEKVETNSKQPIISDIVNTVKPCASMPAQTAPGTIFGSRKRKCNDLRTPDSKRTKYSKDSYSSISKEEYCCQEDCTNIEFDKILSLNEDYLIRLGLEPLIDLHSQLNNAVSGTITTRERLQLPQTLRSITFRYLKLAKKS